MKGVNVEHPTLNTERKTMGARSAVPNSMLDVGRSKFDVQSVQTIPLSQLKRGIRYDEPIGECDCGRPAHRLKVHDRICDRRHEIEVRMDKANRVKHDRDLQEPVPTPSQWYDRFGFNLVAGIECGA